MILPWPSKDERHAAIRSARRERERSQASARKAAELEQQIRRITADNHFAAALAEQIMGQNRGS